MPGVLDADTHIAESEARWSFIDKEMYPRRPVLARIPDDALYEERNAFWLIAEGVIKLKLALPAGLGTISPSPARMSRRRLSKRFCARIRAGFMALIGSEKVHQGDSPCVGMTGARRGNDRHDL